ncbi:MAG: trypsin-like peptidase domain-containing protein, partial [Clostridia bacterium]|nr:trypsin-like peptidase domain-containing protein [Clostridia bacterium]
APQEGGWYQPPQPPVAPPQEGSYTPPRQPDGEWHQPPQPGQAFYRPQSGYSPYGYNPYQQPAPPQPPQRPKRSGANVLVAVLCIICALSVGGLALAVAFSLRQNSPSVSTPASNPSSTASQPKVNSDAPILQLDDTVESTSWAKNAIKKVLPSTVVLEIYSGTTQAGEGSGIIYSADGYIITNAHCVYNSDTGRTYGPIDVILYDGTVYEDATVCGYDTSTDLAVIKVNATGLTPASFGNAEDLELGDFVIAIGDADGLRWSASMGIISGLNRDVYEDTGYAIPCLQVDAAINFGNSGGPLCNAAGQVVGIPSRKRVTSGAENLAFAIPINNESKAIIDSLARNGKVVGRVALGIKGSTVTTLHYEGFYISQIEENSDLKGKASVGDIIQYVNGVRVTSLAELRQELVKNKVGDTITLKLLHIDRRTSATSEYEISVKLIDSASVG